VLSGLGVITAWIAFNATADAFNNVYLAHNFWVLYGLTLAIAYSAIEEKRAAANRQAVELPGGPIQVPPAEPGVRQPAARL
jgi:hypothetical protein